MGSIGGERIRANAWGRYYVTDACNACGVCAVCAPANMGPAWDGTYFAVALQPLDDWQEEGMEAAVAACPLGCLRDDGDA